MRIPVCRPRLPESPSIRPYLERIDANRWYANFGPLVCELEERLSAVLGVGREELLVTSSGTSAIVGGVLASAGWASQDRPFCFMPSYTFVATASAAMTCGYRPFFVDVDETSWLLDPLALARHPEISRAGAVVVVGAFGRPVPNAEWSEFSSRTGVPVVIDAAASFDLVSSEPASALGEVPVAISFHATKTYATGEGGALVWRDAGGAAAARRFLNFGMLGFRRSDVAGVNGKMSEYAAAVGLAELDNWENKRAAYRTAAQSYAAAANARGLGDRILAETRWASPYALFVADSESQARDVRNALARHGIDTRYWFGFGAHNEPAYAGERRDQLPVTERLSRCVVGLPLYPDISPEEIGEVVECIGAALAELRGHVAS